jgi:hypothetical protein
MNPHAYELKPKRLRGLNKIAKSFRRRDIASTEQAAQHGRA